MPKHKSAWNESIYCKRLAEGRGQGKLSNYLPWVRVQDFASRGTISRIAGSKTGRVHHFMSSSEKNYFYLLEWSDEVIDIREQFPLIDIELAIEIALAAGIQYPKDSVSGFPYVLTCDFMINTKSGLKARTIKCSSELSKRRTIEKLEIERRYWQRMGIDWKVVTEHDMSIVKIRNIEWLHPASQLLDIPAENIVDAIVRYHAGCSHSIYETAAWTDKRFGLLAGGGLQIVKRLLWKKIIPCDMDEKILG